MGEVNSIMAIKLSVVIPAFNEVKNLKRGVLDSVYDYLNKEKYEWEVLILDDGSSDKTLEVVRKFAQDHPGFRVFEEPHRGKGGTVIAGIKKARGEVVLFSDMDQSTPIDQVEKFWPKFEKGYDVVIGSRKGRPGQSMVRKIMTLGWVILRAIILGLPFRDTQCGFKAFKGSAAGRIFEKTLVFRAGNKVRGAAVTAGFDLEVLYVARKLGLKVAEVPVEWYEYGVRREVNPIKDSWEGLRDMVMIRLNALRGKYNL